MGGRGGDWCGGDLGAGDAAGAGAAGAVAGAGAHDGDDGAGADAVAAEFGTEGDAGAGVDAGRPDPTRGTAARFLDALADRLVLGVASVVALLDPGCVVLGGEVGQAGGDELAVRVAERIGRMSPLPAEVRPSALGGAAVLRGALLTAQDGAQDELFG